MPELTKIEWTDFTVNFWEGCQKVGPGCDNCYAEARDRRFTGGMHWGPGAPRRKVKNAVGKLHKIDRAAGAFHQEHGRPPRVFCSSLSDIFDSAVPDDWREEAFAEIAASYDCRFQLLTKRIGNVQRLLEKPGCWLRPGGRGWPAHVGLMITVVNQAEADRDIPKLLALKSKLGIPWVGLSVEPMLGPIDLRHLWIHCPTHDFSGGFCLPPCPDQGNLDWVICGGESGQNARPMHPQWARDLRDQCKRAGVPFLFKQWGEFVSVSEVAGPGRHFRFDDGATVRRTGKKIAGRTLNGRTNDEFPAALT